MIFIQSRPKQNNVITYVYMYILIYCTCVGTILQLFIEMNEWGLYIYSEVTYKFTEIDKTLTVWASHPNYTFCAYI